MNLFIITILISIIITTSSVDNDEKDLMLDPKKYIKIYSQCDSNIHTNNGIYYIKPSIDGEIIPVICSNGYTMIDVSLDTNLNSIPSYLSSFDYSRIDANYIIPNLDDTSTFREWLTFADKSTLFRVAKDCQSCQQSSDPLLNDNVVYYTDSLHFCYTTYSGSNACKQNVNEYSCNACDVGVLSSGEVDSDNKYWSQCTALQSSADTPSLHEPQMRVNHHLIYRPIMSLKRNFCTCYQKPNEEIQEYHVLISDLPYVTYNGDTIPESSQITESDDLYIDDTIKLQDISASIDEEEDCSAKIYLTQNDFKDGTYRIRKCGEYVFTEDIVCNFNPPSDEEQADPNFSPNRIDGDELYWFPTTGQANHNDEYPGLYKYVGSFSLGFFAGMTVEVDNVIINLNGFTFNMEKKFYLQQRFFSLIELSSKMFEPIQGPSTWGFDDEYYAKNVEIKGPGVLGITSHHGIHGNLAENVYIHDLDIQHFDVAGIACNGCEELTIENVIIGPQNNQIPTLGRYTHARAFLPRLKHLNDKFGDELITFYGRPQTTVSVLCQRMVNQMDMIYNNWINNKEYDDNDKEWIAAKKIFKNPTGWMDGGSSYGLVINGKGAAVVGIGVRTTETSKISINNVEIFGIYNQAIEKIKFQMDKSTYTTRGILFDTIDWLGAIDDLDDDRTKTQYIGDVYTDAQFAAAKFIDSWYYRNSYFVSQADIDFVFKGNTEENGYPFKKILPARYDYYNDEIIRSCGTDIQLHSSKGAIGMMVNGAQDSQFNNIYIHDVYNWADLGMEICGPYTKVHITFEDIDIQDGYTGTRANGLVIDYTSGDYTNIKIENVESWHGEANGMTIYKQSFVNLGNIVVNNINAGSKLDDEWVAKNLRAPNNIPRACAIDIKDDTEIDYIDGINDLDDALTFDEINGFEICDPFEADNGDGDDDDDESNYFYVKTNLGETTIIRPSLLSISLFMVFFIFIGYVMILKWGSCCNHDQKNLNNLTNLNDKIGENTPLLLTENQLIA